MLPVRVFLPSMVKKDNQLDVHAVEVLQNYLSSNQTVKSELQGTITVI